ncbi:MAG: EcsC family protein [Bdellovibrionales bacterium]|jgi:hypothetical protein|nr:EcsC family protein [Bdellovibrionales bacterium]
MHLLITTPEPFVYSAVMSNTSDSQKNQHKNHLEDETLSNEIFTAEELLLLREAGLFFRDPGLVIKGLSWLGKPIESFQEKLPARAQSVIARTTERAIQKAMLVAVKTIPQESKSKPIQSARLHKGIATLAGTASGLVGLPGLAVELPLTTVVILRSILDQARLYGHDITDLQIQLECLMVFSMGTPGKADDAANSSYFMTRASFAGIVNKIAETAATLSTKELLSLIEKGSAPIIVRMISKVAETFQIRVSQKFLAESVPIVGAIGGGALNYAFTDFFTTTAKYHFAVRALEIKYGQDLVQSELRKYISLKIS